MSVVALLKAARARIERGWCQIDYALDCNGDEIDPCDPGATSWCAFGALLPGSFSLSDWTVTTAEQTLMAAAGYVTIGDWNDEEGRTQADVLNLYDRAIALYELGADIVVSR